MKIIELFERPKNVQLNKLSTERLRDLKIFIQQVETIQHELTSFTREQLNYMRENYNLIEQILIFRSGKESL